MKEPPAEPATRSPGEVWAANHDRAARDRLAREPAADDNHAIITGFAREVLGQLGSGGDPQDVTETVKSLCAQNHILYNGRVVAEAIDSARRRSP